MIQQVPPLPPGLSFEPPQGAGQAPPLPPGLSFEPPARQAAPSRPQARPRPAAPAMPGAPAMAAPMASEDFAPLTLEERVRANMDSGYDAVRAMRLAEEDMAYEAQNDPGMAPSQPAGDVMGYGVVNEQDLAPTDTPESLRAEGYEYDPAAGRWFRVVGSQTLPVEAPAAIAGPDAGMPQGQRLALEQERAALAQREEMGIRRYDQPGFTDQLTAPINDEMDWLVGLGSQAIGNLGRRLTGQEIEVSALDRARAMRDLSREGQEQFQQDKPLQAIGGGLLGGFAFAPARGAAWGLGGSLTGPLRNVPGLAGRLGQAGGVSAAYGAAEGDGVGGRLGSAALSGAIGVGTAGLLEGAVPAGRALLGAVGRARTPAGTLPTRPEQRVGGVLSRALQRDQMDPATVIANMADAPEGRLPFEAGGENLLGLAETMANAPGNARRQIGDAIRTRADGTNDRVSGRLADSFGAQGNGFQAIRQRITGRTEAAREGMAALEGSIVSLDDAAVRALRSGLSSRAVRDAAEEAIAELTPEGSAAANRLFGLGERLADMPAGANITVREAQDISYALKEAASRAYRGGFNSRGEALQNLSNAIRTNARTPERGGVQAYDDWLRSFGDASEIIDSQRVGQNVFAKANERNAMSSAELGEQWAKWSAPARESYRLGVGEAVLDRVRGQGGVTAMRKLLKDSEIAARVRVAFDSEDAFVAFMKTADDEVSMANNSTQVLGNSATARRAAGQADVQGQGFGVSDALDFATDITSPVGLTRQAAKAALRSIPRRDRSVIGDDELNGLLGSALSNEADMTRLLNLMQSDAALRSRVSEQARRFGLLGAPGAVGGGQERARGLLTANP